MANEFDDLDMSEGDLNALTSMLSQSAVWDEPNQETEDAIVAAIGAERSAPAIDLGAIDLSDEQTESNVIPISRARRSVPAFLSGAVAAAVLLVAAFAGATLFGGSDGTELALEATELVPDAVATATVSETPQGTKILLDVSGLPPAEPGTYYEAWLRIDGTTGVSAGTFHLRGGDGSIELWAGVTPDEYPLFTVTLQQEAQEESSGVVLLKGLINSE